MASRHVNPDFLVPGGGVRAEWARMLGSPVGLERPLVVFSGWRALRTPGAILAKRLRMLAGGGECMGVSFTLCNRLEEAVDRAVRTVDQRWPSSDPARTVEVDVVGISMGGLVARAASEPAPGRKRLRIRRLFTLGTPHRGARIARTIAPDPSVRSMKAGSVFLRGLDAAFPAAPYELVCYARLRDGWVGAGNTAPEGHEPIWKPGPIVMGHHSISADRLIITDIARRLRGEEPLARGGSRPPRH